MSSEILYFSAFLVFIVAVLALDLGVFSPRDKEMRFREALTWTFVWVTCALAFYVLLDVYGERLHGITNWETLSEAVKHFDKDLDLSGGDYEKNLALYRHNVSLEFITGYLIEYALSVDNIFVIILIFSSFGVPARYHKRVLFWGVLGAIIMRFIFIFSGAALVQSFSWIFYIFGSLLVYTGIKMFTSKQDDDNIDPQKHPVVRFFSKRMNLFPRFVSHHFLVRIKGKTYITPLFLVLMVIEFTDLVFAVDSVPAVFSITEDPYIIFFSNIFAIIGLRSLFFLITRVMHLFHHLKTGLAILLAFIGLKMIFHEWLHHLGFTTFHSLMIVLSILVLSVVASLLTPRKAMEA